jgi:hypothetical protein
VLAHADPLIGVTARPDDDCTWGEGVAVIEAAPQPHAGALICANCGKHRGWLPNRARDLILETINRFGRPNEPIAYHRGPSSPEGHSKMAFDTTNRGSIFSNKENKKAETDPDYTGSLTVAGTEFWLRGWVKTGKTSGKKFISLSVRPKTEKATAKPAFNDSIDF